MLECTNNNFYADADGSDREKQTLKDIFLSMSNQKKSIKDLIDKAGKIKYSLNGDDEPNDMKPGADEPDSTNTANLLGKFYGIYNELEDDIRKLSRILDDINDIIG